MFILIARLYKAEREAGGQLVSAGDPKQLGPGLRSSEEIQVSHCLCAATQSVFFSDFDYISLLMFIVLTVEENLKHSFLEV